MNEYKFENFVFYDLVVDDLEEILDYVMLNDMILQIGLGSVEHITFHCFKTDSVYLACIYTDGAATKNPRYKTKRGLIQRIKKHLTNGDISPVFQIFGGV